MLKSLYLQPSVQKTQYLPNSNVDFLLNFTGSNLVGGSVRVTGNLHVSKAAHPAMTPVAVADKINYDGSVGINSVWNTVSTFFDENQIETIESYPRLVKMRNSASQSEEDIFQSVKNATELLVSDDTMSSTFLTEQVKYLLVVD